MVGSTFIILRFKAVGFIFGCSHFSIKKRTFALQERKRAMNIQDINELYAVLPQGGALMKTIEEKSVRTVFLQGLLASATPMFFASIAKRWQKNNAFRVERQRRGWLFLQRFENHSYA